MGCVVFETARRHPKGNIDQTVEHASVVSSRRPELHGFIWESPAFG